MAGGRGYLSYADLYQLGLKRGSYLPTLYAKQLVPYFLMVEMVPRKWDYFFVNRCAIVLVHIPHHVRFLPYSRLWHNSPTYAMGFLDLGLVI